jgi:aminoglycoside phosphotransferase family enzyme/predicted kinase
MRDSLPLIIKALLEPECYPHSAQHVEIIETHISWLLLAGEFAYKIKKPITLPFLDYGTLEKRQKYCDAELRLNRQFSPDIYLEVLAIVGTPENPRFSGGGDNEGTAIEFAVKMRRFDEAGRLDHVCARGELDLTHISSLADIIATFHRNSAIAAVTTNFGTPDEVMTPALENFKELHSLLSDKKCLTKLDVLLAWTRTEFNRLTPQFAARKAAGQIRECHGDLHLGNIVLIDGRVTLFDCIEFNEDFRWIDVASEISFTYIDLLDHQQPRLAGWFLNEWLSCSGDYDAMSVLRYYAVYRALVRAKVAALRATQDQGGISETRKYIMLAERLIFPQPPRLIITHGLAGCGKTRASTSLLLSDVSGGTIRLRSDVERKRLFGYAATAKSHSALDDGIYTQAAHVRTYHRLHELAQSLLAAGWSVIVDAAFLKRAERCTFHALATQEKSEFRILAPQASPTLLRARVAARLQKAHDASEATLEVLEQQMANIEPLDADEQNYLL